MALYRNVDFIERRCKLENGYQTIDFET